MVFNQEVQYLHRNIYLMKPLLFLFSASLLCPSVFAQTNVSGAITSNTTWTKANSPYIIKGDVAVDTGKILTIEPGVTVKFDGYYAIYVDGKIKAEGTNADSIRFLSAQSSPSKDNWWSIRFRPKSLNDTSVFKYCIFKHASEALYIESPSLQITNNMFEDNTKAISYSDGYVPIADRRFSSIRYNTFRKNDYGIYRFYEYGGEVAYNIFANNDNGIFINAFCVANINNNTIRNNNYGIKLLTNSMIPIVKNNIIQNNAASGIYIHPSGLSPFADTMSGNEISENKVGLHIYNCSGNIARNTIYNNDTGVIYHYATNLNFKENCLDSNTEYNLVYNQYDDVNISGNYWGTTDSTTIAKSIIDWYDKVTSGRVTFWPYLTGGDGFCKKTTTNISKAEKRTLSFSAYPNPAMEILNISLGKQPASGAYLFVYNLAGVTIHKMPVTSDKLTLNTAQWVPGVYMLRLVNEQETAITKILKE